MDYKWLSWWLLNVIKSINHLLSWSKWLLNLPTPGIIQVVPHCRSRIPIGHFFHDNQPILNEQPVFIHLGWLFDEEKNEDKPSAIGIGWCLNLIKLCRNSMIYPLVN